MRSVFSGIILVFFSIIVISCSNSPGDVLKDMKNSGNDDPVKKNSNYYTIGTLKAFEKLEKLSIGGSDKSDYMDKKFTKGMDWTIIEENIEGNNAVVKVKYTAHPIENMKGLELTFRLVKESGKWKIDMQRELEMSIEMLEMAEKM
ncbi:MAG: DUF4878 domain-containing protein [Spirochaetes bacterium]|nr:DUF4878 domain-containing protein [Spirochaetota bacterium]